MSGHLDAKPGGQPKVITAKILREERQSDEVGKMLKNHQNNNKNRTGGIVDVSVKT